MAALRSDPPKNVAGLDVLAVRDYQQQKRTDRSGARTQLTLPKSNVLAFELQGGSRIVARPSGTEPKIKFYFDHREVVGDEPITTAEARAEEKLSALVDAFVAIAGG